MRSLNDIAVNESCLIAEILSEGSMRQRFLDIGLIKNTPVTCLLKGPLGDPRAYLIRETVIAIRKEDAEKILIKNP